MGLLRLFSKLPVLHLGDSGVYTGRQNTRQLFRPVKWSKVQEARLSDKAVARMVKRYIGDASAFRGNPTSKLGL